MKVPYASVYFTSEKELQEVGALVSAHIFGNVPFSTVDEDVLDVAPWVRLNEKILGCDIEVGGFPGAKGYMLRVRSDGSGLDQLTDDELKEYREEVQKMMLVEHGRTGITYNARITGKYETADLGKYVAMLLQRIDGIELASCSNW